MTADEAKMTALISKALSDLASACDRASSRDDVGFSKSTAGPGHELVALGPARWTASMHGYAARVAAHHAAQLLERRAIDTEEFADLRATGKGSLRSPDIPTDWVDISAFDGGPGIAVSVGRDTDPWLLSALSRIGQDQARQPAGAGRLWKVSGKFSFVVSDHLDRLQILAPAAAELIAKSASAATEEERLLAHRGPVAVRGREGGIVIRMPFDGALHALLKQERAGTLDVAGNWKDVAFALAPDRHGHAVFLEFAARYPGHARGPGVDSELAAMAVAEPAPPARREAAPLEMIISGEATDTGEVAIRFSRYDALWVDAVKSLPREYRRYDGPRGWIVNERTLPELADAVEALGRESDIAAADTLRAMAPPPPAAGPAFR